MKYLKVLWENKRTIHNIALHKLKAQYAEQAFGIFWAILNPLVYVFSFWFFFSVGLKGGGPIDGNPFIMWLFPGVLAYKMTSSLVNHATGYISKNRTLVKTIRFPVMTLPVIEILKEIYVHAIVMGIMVVLYTIIGATQSCGIDSAGNPYGCGLSYAPTIHYINLIYYWFTMLVFGTGVALILSPLGLLIRDTKNLVNALMQPVFWITPVLYYAGNSPVLELANKIFNPIYYFVYGYRETFLYHNFFFEEPIYMLWIWFYIFILYIIGMRIWKNTRELMPDLM